MVSSAPLTEADYGTIIALTTALADGLLKEAARMERLVEASEIVSPGRELYWEGYIDGMRDAAADLKRKVVTP